MRLPYFNTFPKFFFVEIGFLQIPIAQVEIYTHRMTSPPPWLPFYTAPCNVSIRERKSERKQLPQWSQFRKPQCFLNLLFMKMLNMCARKQSSLPSSSACKFLICHNKFTCRIFLWYTFINQWQPTNRLLTFQEKFYFSTELFIPEISPCKKIYNHVQGKEKKTAFLLEHDLMMERSRLSPPSLSSGEILLAKWTAYVFRTL